MENLSVLLRRRFMKKIMISIFILASIFVFAEEVQEISETFNKETTQTSEQEVKVVESEEEKVAPQTTNSFFEYRPQALIDLDNQIAIPANRGRLRELNAQYDNVLKQYLEAHSYESDRIFYLANEYMLLNNYDRANKIFLKDNKDIKNIFGAATTYRFMGQNQNAIDKYDQVIFNNPSFAEAYLGRGLAYRNMDKYEEAEKDLKNYLALTSSHEAYVALADVYFKLGKNKEAYNIANQGLAKYGNSKILKTLSSNILKNKID